MPTKREREYYARGFTDAMRMASKDISRVGSFMEAMEPTYDPLSGTGFGPDRPIYGRKKPKRKLSAWQKYIKNKRNHITYRDGKLNLKAMGVQYRKKKRR